MGYETLMRHFKTPSALAKALLPYGEEISVQAIYKWREAGVPVERAPMIEAASRGAVRCEAMCPGWTWVRDGKGKLVARQIEVRPLRRKAA
jgi:hypothetical protein